MSQPSPLEILQAFDPHPTLGALEIGVIISSCLFGILSAQCWMYFDNFPKDSWKMKTLVAVVWCLELGHTVCVSHAVYTLTITQYGNPLALAKTPTTLNASTLLSGFIGPLVQAIFTARVYRFSGRIFLPAVCWLVSFLRLVGSLVMGVEAITMISVVQFEDDWGWLVTTILSLGAAVDVVIALALCYYLRDKRDIAFDRTTRMVDKLMKWAIETGAVSSLLAISVAIAFSVMRDNFVWIALYTFLARCFSNSLLATLNGRVHLREVSVASPSTGSIQRRMGHSGSKPGITSPIEISIERSRVMESTTPEFYSMDAMRRWKEEAVYDDTKV